ncbi:hypothetical protein ACRARG_15110 [Pseudooceanicola sp. C21-150M6]|uniref:HoxN/HupN/NixA family nickel/cobalt transporter n=1 Tax=Pseudooceanicola sp. C21-150M6 TaxID=3434355 RepID=UPI003D7F9095
MRLRRVILWLPFLALIGCAGWLWLGPGMAQIAAWAAAGQKEAQSGLAGALRGLRQGQGGAFLSLMALCFLYGLFHAAGPGHGKLLLGGYGLARPVAALRLSGLAIASSMAQAATAVLLVAAGFGLLGIVRGKMTALADGTLASSSYAAVALVGLYLALRGARALWQSLPPIRLPGGQSILAAAPGMAQVPAPHVHMHSDPHTHLPASPDAMRNRAGQGQKQEQGQPHGHDHAHDPHGTQCEAHSAGSACGCGHVHGPTAEQAENVRSLRDAVLLILAIAIRPCTGALFLLIIAWQMQIFAAGIAGAFAMGAGTATVTVAAALAASWMRRSGIDRLGALLPSPQATARAAAALELGAGLLVTLVSFDLLMRSL